MKEGKYLLIYNINEYPGNGGGRYVEYLDTLEEMSNTANEIMNNEEEDASIEFAGLISKEFECTPIEKVIKHEFKEKKQ